MFLVVGDSNACACLLLRLAELVWLPMRGSCWRPTLPRGGGRRARATSFSVALSPSSGSVTGGRSATAVLATAVTSGSVQTVTVAANGAPAGVAVSFNSVSVSAGGSSTMTISASSVVPGTYAITVTGSAGSVSHAATDTLTVNV
jgi:aminopeptidase S